MVPSLIIRRTIKNIAETAKSKKGMTARLVQLARDHIPRQNWPSLKPFVKAVAWYIAEQEFRDR